MGKSSNRASLAWIAGVCGRQKLDILLLVIIQGLLSGTGVVMTLCFRNLIDGAVNKDEQVFWLSSAFLAGIAIFHIAFRTLDRFLDERTKASIENCLKGRLFSCLLSMDYAAVTRVHSGEWLNRLTSDTAVVSEGVTSILPGVFGMFAKLAGALALISFLAPKLTLFLLPLGVLLLLFSIIFRKQLKRLHKNIQEEDGKLRVFLMERLGSMLVVRSFAKVDLTLQGAESQMKAHKDARMSRNRFSNLSVAGFGLVMQGAFILTATWCGWGILNGTMSYGTLIAVLQLIGQVQGPFANLSGYLPRFYAMLASAERLMEAEAFGEDYPKGYQSPAQIKQFYQGSFRGFGMSNASFQYKPISDDEPVEVIRGLDLEISKGEYVALTGPSGCGKSTILKLLMCLYPLDSGEIYFLSSGDRQPLTSAHRGLFGYVPQGNQLMRGSIRDILSFGDSEVMADEARLHQALKISCADEFICQMEQGLDTILGERGAGLSEGQMQRIAIARALLADRPILLLDEATSSLDEATEARLLVNLRSMTDNTVIIVTHRAAALDICDRQIELLPGNMIKEAKL